MILTEAELAAIRKQAEAEYPAECCGVLLVRGGLAERLLHPCRNIQNTLHAQDPARFPRDARTAYYIAHDDLIEISRKEIEGYRVHAIYHSHVDVGAYFSETDRRQALVDGQPAYPTAIYVVVAVNGGRAGEARAFRWGPCAGQFAEIPLAVE
ncbi:MAG: M67 family metallopeptidase [Candidatus Rokubacteria bacterium]|nr:M67 family metallopeptidase [Candidatus Rokubacteria bacterium]